MVYRSKVADKSKFFSISALRPGFLIRGVTIDDLQGRGKTLVEECLNSTVMMKNSRSSQPRSATICCGTKS